MPRIRTIKPVHWTDKNLSKISLEAHLLWIATWNFSDDLGIFENDPLLLRSNIFPRRTDIKLEHITKWLTELQKYNFIIPFEFEGEPLYVTRTFRTNQRIDKPQPSKVPVNKVDSVIQEHSKNVQGMIQERSALYSIVQEGSVEEAPPSSFSYKDFISLFNSITERAYTGDIKSKDHFAARIKEGRTKEQFEKAILAASKDKWTVDGNYLTPEYISRSNQLEKWSNVVVVANHFIENGQL